MLGLDQDTARVSKKEFTKDPKSTSLEIWVELRLSSASRMEAAHWSEGPAEFGGMVDRDGKARNHRSALKEAKHGITGKEPTLKMAVCRVGCRSKDEQRHSKRCTLWFPIL